MCRPGELQNGEYLHWRRLFSLLRFGFVFVSLPGVIGASICICHALPCLILSCFVLCSLAVPATIVLFGMCSAPTYFSSVCLTRHGLAWLGPFLLGSARFGSAALLSFGLELWGVRILRLWYFRDARVNCAASNFASSELRC
jgi:hypothetical protein